jgi:hypothetical protein
MEDRRFLVWEDHQTEEPVPVFASSAKEAAETFVRNRYWAFLSFYGETDSFSCCVKDDDTTYTYTVRFEAIADFVNIELPTD